jgi:DNA-binding response OmpR family regulator
MTRVVIINEDQTFCQEYQKALRKEGFEVEVYYDGKVGLTHVLVAHPEVIILGLMLPTMNGFDVLEVLKK